MKIFLKKTSNFSCHIEIEVVVLHPLRESRKLTNETKNKIRHVPRHIELTAVLTEMLEQKNKSNRIERF